MAQKIKRTQITDSFATFTPATMQNGWIRYDTEYRTPGYYKDAMGVVHLQGLIKGGTILASAFTLPEGFRPSARSIFTTLTGANNTAGRIDILSNGQVVPQTGVNNAWVTLEGIQFLADQ